VPNRKSPPATLLRGAYRWAGINKQKKIKMKKIILLAVTLGACFGAYAQGSIHYIIPNGIRAYTQKPTSIAVKTLDPWGEMLTGFLFYTGPDPNVFGFDHFMDGIGLRTFLVREKDVLDLNAIQTEKFNELYYGHDYTFKEGESFYMGVYTGSAPRTSEGLYETPLYGWALLSNDTGEITLKDSALGYAGYEGGIIVGTSTLVPEPGTWALWALGVALISCARHRKS
jgi:hypothetical protein